MVVIDTEISVNDTTAVSYSKTETVPTISVVESESKSENSSISDSETSHRRSVVADSLQVITKKSVNEYNVFTDSLSVSDNLDFIREPEYGLIIDAPSIESMSPHRDAGNEGVSFILSGLFILALIIALRFRDNVKYILAIINDLMTTRIRQNAFDDTVRETSLLVMLNILWCSSVGILIYSLGKNFDLIPEGITSAVGMLVGMVFAVVYTMFLYIAYWGVGTVFSDRSHAQLWVKGYAASQALMAPAFFITALLSLSTVLPSQIIGICVVTVFVAGKMAFIFKGYRIFFNQISSWVLFLCYLCSLEIVPLVLCYRCALLLS